eukprot:CAMPEP_0170479582 /NCGR_PEP_ID=MMETSP0208-20121228/758_1 /TAXON_ID=197538 /ORGANISM="Strombidium inclinatum, Strain S3" /LENGTH=114 /DNA_ID=CAMNT_0010752003 /DNA_START=272 /DNA_END=616 /DNA_ORIENTATION=+
MPPGNLPPPGMGMMPAPYLPAQEEEDEEEVEIDQFNLNVMDKVLDSLKTVDSSHSARNEEGEGGFGAFGIKSALGGLGDEGEGKQLFNEYTLKQLRTLWEAKFKAHCVQAKKLA